MSKVLIVVDMQNDFVSGSLGTKEATQIVEYVKEKIENFDGDVYFTRDTHQENYLETNEGKHLPVKHCIENTWGWQIIDELKPLSEKSKAIFNKPTFGYKEFPEKLKQLTNQIESIELCGLCTDICVVSNALLLKANYPDIQMVVDSKACAGVSVETHEAALKTMKMCQIEIL